MKYYIATSREIGERCRELARSNPIEGWVEGTLEDCDILISIMYEELFTENFLAGKRAYNFHPGILPQYRGSGAFSWAILNGDHTFGITIHEMDKSIDHGKIIYIGTQPIENTDTAENLYQKGMEMIFEGFQKFFHKLLTEDYEAKEQNETLSRMYYRKDLEKAKDLTKFVRAFTFRGKENAYYYDRTGKRIELVY